MTKRKKKSNSDVNDANKSTNSQKRRKLNSRTGSTSNSKSSGGRSRMWIEQCKKTRRVSKKVSSDLILQILISRVELLDGHGCGDTITPESIEKNNDEESVAAATAAKEHNSLSVKVQTAEEKNEEESSANNVIDACAQEEEKEDTGNSENAPRTPFIQVVRLSSAKGDRKNPCHFFSFQELPNGDCGDGIVNPHPKDQVPDKYWAQRKRLFSKFEQGIELDQESWYSVTPEVISKHIAKRVPCLGNNSSFGKKVVLDAFCGVGGNAIGFALEKDISLVVCVDIDLNKLKMAAKNASVYNVDPGKIVFIEGDAIQVLNLYRNGKLLEQSSTTKDSSKKEICHGYTIHGLAALPVSIDCVFLSPPWGGTEYLKSGNDGYRLSCMKVMMTGTDQCDDKNDECSGDELLSKSAMAAKDKQVVCFLPRNINGFDVGTCAWKAGYTRQSHIELEQNILNAKLKAVTVYLH